MKRSTHLREVQLAAILFASILLCCADAPPAQTRNSTQTETSGSVGDSGGDHAATQELADLRIQIDALDRELVALLNRRAEYVLQLAPLKRQIGVGVLDPRREEDVRRNLRAANDGPLADEAVEKIYAAIMAAMRHLQAEK